MGMGTVIIAILLATSVTGCCGSYEERIASLEQQLSTVQEEKAGVESSLSGRIAELEKYQKALETELEKLGVDRKELAEKYNATMSDLSEKNKQIQEMQKKEAMARKRLNTMKNMLGKFKNMIETGKLKVKVKNNKMVLELPSAILFDSGKADLNNDGKATLQEVAQVLETIPDREFQVAGHTDDDPLTKRSKFTSNWELSTARAVAVVSFLQQSGVKPTSLSAAGYSEYQPSAPNNTEKNKALNRRIEITLMPNIEELPDLSDLEKML